MPPRLAWLLSSIALLACSGGEAKGAPAAATLPAGRVFQHVLTIPGGSEVVIRVAATRGSPRPALHLWDREGQREVARAGGDFRFGATDLSFRAASGDAQELLLIVRATHAAGRVDVERNGSALARDVELSALPVPAHGLQRGAHLVARRPDSPRSALLLGLSAEGALIALDTDSGPVDMPALPHRVELRSLVLASTGATAGALQLYANDLADDRDGDGLGAALEAALGTCDHADDAGCAGSVLEAYYRASPRATRDTDRDGLDDGDELLGVANGRLDLPGWGASPRHKDVFVEVDYQRVLDGHHLRPEDIETIAALFAEGSARDLRNPDGKPGVALHLDVGMEPERREHAGLYGDWGGSGRVPARAYKKMRHSQMDPARRGFFRYALALRTGVGQSSGDAMAFNTYRARARIFAHELGHLLGVEHHGEDAWGKHGCKPGYRSVMNYIYQNQPGVGFSMGSGREQNPAATLEAGALGTSDPEELTAPPLELDVVGDSVDLNRDGLISTRPVRAGLTWATYKSCASAGHARATVWEGEAPASTPALLRAGDRLHTFFVTGEGVVMWSWARVSGPDGEGSCPRGDGARRPCMTWSRPRALPVVQGYAVAAAVTASADVVLSVTDTDGALWVGAVPGLETDEPHAPELVRVPGARVRGEPTLVPRPAHGPGGLMLLWRDHGSDRLMQGDARAAGGAFDTRPALDRRGAPLSIGRSPSAAWLGTGELCGVFPDTEGFIRFHCHDPALDAWVDLSVRAFDAGLGPTTGGRVSIAYHRHRFADGSPVAGESARGAVYLGFTEASSSRVPDNPHVLISEWLDRRHGARARIRFRWRGRPLDEWTNLAPGAGFALYEDAELSALKALMPLRGKKPGPVKFEALPLADGTFDARLRSGNDFLLMERGICLGLHDRKRCGSAQTW